MCSVLTQKKDIYDINSIMLMKSDVGAGGYYNIE